MTSAVLRQLVPVCAMNGGGISCGGSITMSPMLPCLPPFARDLVAGLLIFRSTSSFAIIHHHSSRRMASEFPGSEERKPAS